MTKGDQVYNVVTDTFKFFNMIKDYEVGYSNPRSGKLIVNKGGQNFLFSIEPLETNDGTLHTAMEQYHYVFEEDLK